ncbi:MAG: hypothetical protein HDQ88_10105 [Clostridia bacterium]|nr:hypothetical protein [Clostridia bacterium]
MKFDVITLTDEEIDKLTAVQMQLLRTAQKNKNELIHKYGQELALFKKLVYTDDMQKSSLLAQKQAELEAELNYQIEIIVEQLEYGLALNEPFIPDDFGNEKVGYIVDYSLSYTERYKIVLDYYLSIKDPSERMSLYSNDAVAKNYLSSYYSTLYDVLYTYSK